MTTDNTLPARLRDHADGIDRIAHGPSEEGADMRSAADILEALAAMKAHAWDEGYDAGWDAGYDVAYRNHPRDPLTPVNPYRIEREVQR